MADPKPKKPARTTRAKKPAAKKASTSRASASSKPKADAAKTGAAKPAPDLPGRIDGLRGWLDQIERRQGRMGYILGAGMLIALAAAGVALYLGITANQDMAEQSDLDALRTEVTQTKSATSSEVDEKIDGLNKTIAALQQQVTAAQQQAQQAKQQAAQAPAQFTPAPPVITPDTTGTDTGKNNTGGKTP